MSHNAYQKLPNAFQKSKDSPMSPALEAKQLLIEIAGPMPAGSQIQEMLTTVWAELQKLTRGKLVTLEKPLSFGRLRSFHHGKAVVRSDEMDALRAAAARRKQAAQEAGRAELRSVSEELAILQRQVDAVRARLAGPSSCSFRAPNVSGGDDADEGGFTSVSMDGWSR